MEPKFRKLILCVLLVPLLSFSQVKIAPFVSSGYMYHLGRSGLNSKVGLDIEFINKANLSAAYRYAKLDKDTNNEVEIKAFSFFLSYVFIHNEHHKLMAGPGFSSGNYKRYTANIGFEKEYKDTWLDFGKIRYDYIFNSKFKTGLDFSVYGDDGDDSMYFGVVVGYNFH